MAKDGFGREIDYLRLSITDRCNLSCIYCMPGGRQARFRPEDIMTASDIEGLVRAAMGFGLRKIRLTGGEPLLRKDVLSIVSSVKASGVRDLSLTTNGILLAGMAGALKKAGLDRVNVSLDSLDPSRYGSITAGGRLESVLEGIRAAELAGLDPVKINMVPIRGVNDDEIPAFARLTLQKPYHIRFIEFMPSGRRHLWSMQRCVTVKEVMERISAIAPLNRLEFKGKGPSRNYRMEGADGILGFISPVTHGFCYSCNRLRVNAVGRIRPCLFSRTEVDVGTPLRNGADVSEIERLFSLAIDLKPEGNHMGGKTGVGLGSMSSIGG